MVGCSEQRRLLVMFLDWWNFSSLEPDIPTNTVNRSGGSAVGLNRRRSRRTADPSAPLGMTTQENLGMTIHKIIVVQQSER
jgi:hypothetical protein